MRPARVSPSASAAAVIVEAVPIVMHWPGERAIAASSVAHSASLMVPARFSSQKRHMSVPLPSVSRANDR